MADALVRLGDLAPSEVVGPMAGFLAELERSGRAQRLRWPGTVEPDRWISAEDSGLYASAFPEGPGAVDESSKELETVVQALYLEIGTPSAGLGDSITARCLFSPGLAT